MPPTRRKLPAPVEHVHVRETGEGKFQNSVQAGGHRLFAHEPESLGGLDSGPSPYDFLAIALGACTSMTLRLYAGHKQLKLGRIGVDVSHTKIDASLPPLELDLGANPTEAAKSLPLSLRDRGLLP